MGCLASSIGGWELIVDLGLAILSSDILFSDRMAVDP